MEGNGASNGSPLSASQPSSSPNTVRSLIPEATHSLNAAGAIPESRPARLILRPYEMNSPGYPGMSPLQSPQSENLRFYNSRDAGAGSFKSQQLRQQQPQPPPKYQVSLDDMNSKMQNSFVTPMKPVVSTLPAMHEAPQRPPVGVGRATLPLNAYDLPPPLLERKHPKEQSFLQSWSKVDLAGAIATSRLERVPLPMLERVPGGTCRPGLQGPLVRIRLPQLPSVEGDLRRFCQRILAAFSGAADDCRRLFVPCTDLRLPRLQCCAPQPPVIQECKECGYKGHFCPECGTGANGSAMSAAGMPYARMQPSRGVLVAQEGCLERCMRWHCSLFEEVGDAIDQEILCDRAGGIFREFGEFVDNLVAEGIHTISLNCAGLCGSIPGRSHTIVEGYPMYEPDPQYVRKERPTSTTGNACVDQLNAFLDACLAGRSKLPPDYLPPPIPDTQKTGNWLIDATNAALDYCLQDRTPPPPPPPRKKTCPLEMLVPPCCRERPPPVVVPQKQPMCPLLERCMGRERDCPHCHQPIRRSGGKCPKEEIGGCQIQFCPVREPAVTVLPTGPSLVYPYREEGGQCKRPDIRPLPPS